MGTRELIVTHHVKLLAVLHSVSLDLDICLDPSLDMNGADKHASRREHMYKELEVHGQIGQKCPKSGR